MNKEQLENQITLMKKYASMMLNREDWHGLWDAAIDLQRLSDKLEWGQNTIKKSCTHHCNCYDIGMSGRNPLICCNCGKIR